MECKNDLPTRQSVITIQPITAANWRDVTSLVVNAYQTDLVQPNFVSLCEHQFYPSSVVRCVVADNKVVGYIRYEYSQCPPQNQDSVTVDPANIDNKKHVSLLLFMIDQACQGLGFGSKAMTLLIEDLRSQGVISISLSTKTFGSVEPDDSPEHFFAFLGFKRFDDNRMSLDLTT